MARKTVIGISGASAPENKVPFSADSITAMQNFWLEELNLFLPEKPDLIVLPECCDRWKGLSRSDYKKYCSIRKDSLFHTLQEWAKKHSCMIAYCANRFREDNTYANSISLISKTGKPIAVYDKNYPMEQEMEAGIIPGKDIAVASTEIGRIGFAICFDLNFDPLFQKYAEEKLDLLLFSSVFHGGLLQAVRSRECFCHFAGAVSGERCSIVNPLGEVIAESSNYIPRLCTTVNLDCRVVHYDNNFDKLKLLKEKYGRAVTIHDPGRTGTVLVTSEADDITVDTILKEFQIEDYASYRARSQALADEFRQKNSCSAAGSR